MKYNTFLIVTFVMCAITLSAKANFGDTTNTSEENYSNLPSDSRLSMTMEACYRFSRSKGTTASQAFAFCKFYLSENTRPHALPNSNAAGSERLSDAVSPEVAL